jgi:hypothetical protein
MKKTRTKSLSSIVFNNCIIYYYLGSPHLIKTGQHDFSLGWLEGVVREIWGTSEKLAKF